jgi:hypothetical protein
VIDMRKTEEMYMNAQLSVDAAQHNTSWALEPAK